jgi:calcineurin-like phosphoesterase family protein
MIYFTSDTHFFDTQIIKKYGRKFQNIVEMHKKIITNWNSIIGEGDEVFFLGDLLLSNDGRKANGILNNLNGIKYLIRGNHDNYVDDKEFDKTKFKWIKDYHILNYKKYKFVLFHYPIFEWDGYFSDSIHLYGHIHNEANYPKQQKRFKAMSKRSINVGIDLNDFFPVSIDKIIENIKTTEHTAFNIYLQDERKRTKSDLMQMWHLTDINNIPSIFEFGLLSRNFLNKLSKKYIDNSTSDLTKKRERLGLNDYVPFHFMPSNPYDIYEFQKHKDRYTTFCYITIMDKTAEELGAKVQLEYPNHKSKLELYSIPACINKINNIRYHTDYNYRLQKYNALGECLIKEKLDTQYFNSIIVGSDENKHDLEEFAKAYNLPDLYIETRKGYFSNWYDKKIFYHKEIVEKQRREANGNFSLEDL